MSNKKCQCLSPWMKTWFKSHNIRILYRQKMCVVALRHWPLFHFFILAFILWESCEQIHRWIALIFIKTIFVWELFQFCILNFFSFLWCRCFDCVQSRWERIVNTQLLSFSVGFFVRYIWNSANTSQSFNILQTVYCYLARML